MPEWWQTFFDADYLRVWEAAEAPDKTAREVSGLRAPFVTPGSPIPARLGILAVRE